MKLLVGLVLALNALFVPMSLFLATAMPQDAAAERRAELAAIVFGFLSAVGLTNLVTLAMKRHFRPYGVFRGICFVLNAVTMFGLPFALRGVELLFFVSVPALSAVTVWFRTEVAD